MKLEIEEILCLQMLGYKADEIMKADTEFFDEELGGVDDAEETLKRAEALLKRQRRLGIITLPYYHPDFPESLRSIKGDCPPLIHLLGNADLLAGGKAAVAVVGARQADKKGCEVAYRLGAGYARKGSVVVSGLALGVDAAAHRGCLDAGGETIAVVATGLDITHPSENRPLQAAILSHKGLLLSEQMAGVKANPSRLVARNRLQAALSQELVVAQCPEHSGTMHTVRFARRYCKRVYAVSFPRYDAYSSGNEKLIAE